MDDASIGREQAQGLHAVLRAAKMDLGELWRHYFRIGGDAGEIEVEAYLHHALTLPALQRDLLAHACNELTDGQHPHRAPYASDFPNPAARGEDGAGNTGSDTKLGSAPEDTQEAPAEHDDPADPDG